MKQILVFLTTGFEEIEALTSVDVLRRADLNVITVSLEPELTVIGRNNIPVIADILFEQIDMAKVQMLVLPGGTQRINEHAGLRVLVTEFAKNNGKISAICIAPMVLGSLGLLEGKKATIYPNNEKYLTGAEALNQAVVVDGNFITGQGPAFSMQFALTLVENILGKAKRDEIAAGLLYK